ncbi:MAG TPA: SGNH/GDSL hydrolase family protein [Acidimicrobiia bacterium]
MNRRLCVVGAVVGLVVACSGQSRPTPPALAVGGQTAHSYTGNGPKVVVLGDSLTVRSWTETYDDLTNDHAVMAAAWDGEGYGGGPLSARLGGLLLPDAAKTYATTHPDVAVLALGTNDVWVSTRDIHGALLEMVAMVDELKPACLVGVTIPETSVLGDWNGTNARVLNDAMRGWANKVVDWAAISRQRGITGPDHVHPTKQGAERRAAAIASAVRSCTSS